MKSPFGKGKAKGKAKALDDQLISKHSLAMRDSNAPIVGNLV